ncbi:MAG: asparagine synthase (glutamine-hydrolyzing) [Ignavibacteriales bacterium]|nr:MAG: asparagine synthase (glutamine-hydrolyzing) [Ignavibacteriales bacterium]
MNFNGRQTDIDAVIRARDIITHRGPDDSGIFTSADMRAVLAHRRLSIIDLSEHGHQPMSTGDGRYTIVFNGEIYNYEELREGMGKGGSGEGTGNEEEIGKDKNKFRSHSDTEVLLYLYAEYGAECLKLLRGMFAFAVWDEKEKTLFAARDRFGIKPFYYLHNNGEFVFSSELKAIKYYKDNLTVSYKAVDAFLRTGSVPAPLTIYNETLSLEPGSWIKVNASGKAEIKRWWSFTDLVKNNTQKKVYDNNAKEIIREALCDAVKAHCVADVEVGAFLSGGIDSTSIVSLMKQTGYHKIKTISISFPGNKLDESKYSRLAADHYFTAHYEYNLEEGEVIERMYDLIGMMDQPTIDGVNTYFISHAAKDFGLKVVMSGLGGDELFGGYPSFKNVPKYDRILKMANTIPFAGMMMRTGAGLLKKRLPAKALDVMNNPSTVNAGFKMQRGLFTDSELSELGFSFNGNSSKDMIFATESEGLTALQKISQLESMWYMGCMLLRDSDVFSMLNSLELRVPFVDHKLYETVLPYLDKSFDTRFPKRMLVEGTGDLPNELVFRPKMGFTFPFVDWIKSGKLGVMMKDSLLTGKLRYFDKKGVENLFNRFESGRIHWSRLWAVNVIEKFQ